MIETFETGRCIKDSEFSSLQKQLRERLLKAQLEHADQDYPVVILIVGQDGAGKGSVVQRLNEWMDPRRIETNTFWEQSDEENCRPFFWRFWRTLPARGRMGVYLGTWYNVPAQAAINGELTDEELARCCQQIESFERLLTDDGALVIKLWLQISKKTQHKRLQNASPHRAASLRSTDKNYELRGKYHRTQEVAEQILVATDTAHTPWYLLDAEDQNYRDITAGELIVAAMERRASNESIVSPAPPGAAALAAPEPPGALEGVNLAARLGGNKYDRKLEKYGTQLHDLAWRAFLQKRSVVAVFEGWDAAGKGSAIRRVTRAIDPRLFSLLQFAAPTDEERAQHYLWRFWRKLQRDGRSTFFDRSWYGRVLVERVEQFASPGEWQRAYSEINQFERQLVDHGCIVLKFWIHISKDEQERRFLDRQNTPYKHHKLTAEDWRNRQKWPEYERAVNQMVYHTSTPHAPWTLVAGDNKKYARIKILKTFCAALNRALAD